MIASHRRLKMVASACSLEFRIGYDRLCLEITKSMGDAFLICEPDGVVLQLTTSAIISILT